MNPYGKRAVVTGAARGIGYQICRRLLEYGAAVSLWDVDEAALAAAAETLGELGEVRTAVCDVRDGAAVRKCADETIAALGQVDILVNNAGFMAPGYFLDQPAEQWEKTVAVNLQGVISTVRAFLPHMYERGTGRIINISSAAGLIGVPGLSVYSASKWGVFGLTEALREEAWASGHPGVKYSSVHPMFLLTGMFEGARLRGLGGLVFPCVKSHDRIAKAVVEGAVVRGRRCIKRPRSLRAVLLLRGLLPDAVFAGIGRFMKLHASMESWKGRATEKERV